MSEQDFNFPPAQRRTPKQFEPPPWERDAFDEIERAREAERKAAEAAEAERQAAAAVARARDDAAGTDADATLAPSPEPKAQPDPAASDSKVSEAQLTELMAGLRAEEPTSMETYGAVALALSVFTGLVGAVMLIWAMAMFVSSSARGTGRVGLISGSIVAFFGALFIGLSIWVAVRTLRQRGVL